MRMSVYYTNTKSPAGLKLKRFKCVLSRNVRGARVAKQPTAIYNLNDSFIFKIAFVAGRVSSSLNIYPIVMIYLILTTGVLLGIRTARGTVQGVASSASLHEL